MVVFVKTIIMIFYKEEKMKKVEFELNEILSYLICAFLSGFGLGGALIFLIFF